MWKCASSVAVVASSSCKISDASCNASLLLNCCFNAVTVTFWHIASARKRAISDVWARHRTSLSSCCWLKMLTCSSKAAWTVVQASSNTAARRSGAMDEVVRVGCLCPLCLLQSWLHLSKYKAESGNNHRTPMVIFLHFNRSFLSLLGISWDAVALGSGLGRRWRAFALSSLDIRWKDQEWVDLHFSTKLNLIVTAWYGNLKSF